MTLILGIETSCDETSVAIVENGVKVLSNVVKTQAIHSNYGGVVPDLSSREHVNFIFNVFSDAIKMAKVKVDDIDVISVVNGPGLVGSLMVGVSFAQALGLRYSKKLIITDHVIGHIYGNVLTYGNLEFPMISLVVSGGHTSLFLVKEDFSLEPVGKTLDDAAGEAFDKCAKLLNLGYPGGPMIEKYSKEGDQNFFKFPVARVSDYNFSFSGLKTSVLYYLRSKDKDFIEKNIHNIAASIQKAVVDQLLSVMKKYFIDNKKRMIRSVSIAGGVSANSYLRNRFINLFKGKGCEIYIPNFEYCTDNAALTAGYAYLKYKKNEFSDIGIKVYSRN